MPSIITPAQLTFSGKQVEALSEAILTAVVENPRINELVTIVTGVKAKQQIGILGALGLVGRTFAGCEPTANPGQITMSEKFWDPKYIEDRFTQCWKDLIPSFWQYGFKNGVRKPDLTDTDFANFVESRIEQALIEAVYRIAFFADTTHSPVGDATGNQVLTTGVDKTFFNMLNGIWNQVFSIGTADANRRVTITQNAGANKAAQAFTTQNTTDRVVSGYLESLVLGADYRLRSSGSLQILVTQSIADQYVKELKGQNLDAAYARRESGISQLMFDGIPLVPVITFDQIIRSYFDNGTKWHMPHRMLLSTKENLQVATEEESNLSELNPFYLEKEKTYNVDFGFNLDAKVIENQMIQAAY